MPSYSIATCFFGIILGVERFTLKKTWGYLKIYGIIITTSGGIIIVVINFLKNKNTSYLNIYLGVVILILNVMFYSMGMIIQKKFLFNKSKKKEEGTTINE
jgi:hypothetical protein